MRIGSYDLLEEIGRGAMGVVFRARAADGRALAIKIVHAAGNATARLDRERRMLEELGSGHGFVPVLDAGTAPEGAYLVMPFVGGGTLRDRLQRGPLGIEETVELGSKLARALGEAH